ncbi:MAG: hypothetical protein MJ248_00100 [Bacilli bacterium]|nr:hypothetical protein [Bacilli bacterium]
MKNSNIFIPLIALGFLCSCNGNTSNNTTTNSGTNDNVTYLTPEDNGTATIKIHKGNDSTSKNRYLPPKNVDIKYTYNDLNGLLAETESVCPSVGDVNLLVIPVHIPGSEKYKTDKVKHDIETMFFSTDSDEMATPSLKEYYYQSSFGKLNFDGVVTDWFDITEHLGIESDKYIAYRTFGSIILPKAVEWAVRTQDINLKDFDRNNDGNIDGVWLVYDHLNVINQMDFDYRKSPETFDYYSYNQTFYKFTNWDYTTSPNLKNPTTSGYSVASFDMMYSSYANRDADDFIIDEDFSNDKLDSHSFVHETGHLLGLRDYISSSSSSSHPAGGFTMMDGEVGDFDSYSKLLLGWVTPYVVYGSSEILIPTATSSDHGVIVVPNNFNEISSMIERQISQGTIDQFRYSFNPFSEYLLIDLYSPDGLNAIDVFGSKDGKFVHESVDGVSETGVRIYHIDSRIFKVRVVNYEGGSTLSYTKGYVWDGNPLSYDESLLMPISNSKTENSDYNLPIDFDFFEQIRLVEASGINTFDKDGVMTSRSLFTNTTSGFDIDNFGYQFFNAKYTFNSGNELPFKIDVLTLKEIY